jgi:aspartyl-tRNA(Asn)/glutamyl-tRNA(Gln) amidotransferase subunit A
MEKICDMSVRRLSQALEKKELSATEAVLAYLDAIEQKDAQIGAYLTVTADHALAQAAQIDQLRQSGSPLGRLAGVPMGLKDNLCTRGVRTTCASRMLENFVPPYDATAVSLLTQAGAVCLGKLNMDEFAMGSSTETSYFKKTCNPADPNRVPGGSSGGSTAAVAAGEAAFTLGSDTGGSIRQPAAFCGTVGMKPTYGAVSRYGLIAFASSLDQIGPLTRSVYDNAMVLSAIAAHDPMDATSARIAPQDYTQGIEDGVRGMTVGIPRAFLGEGLDPQIAAAVRAAAAALEDRGAVVREVDLNVLDYALPAYYILSSAEASSNLARFDGIRFGRRAEKYADLEQLYCLSRAEGFGKEVKLRILLGTYALSAGYYDAYYKKAQQARASILADFTRCFETCDFILAPTTPTTAYRFGEKTHNPVEMYLGDIYTVPVNIAGLPAMSLPYGQDDRGLPIGVQLIGNRFDEKTLYRAAYALETGGTGNDGI